MRNIVNSFAHIRFLSSGVSDRTYLSAKDNIYSLLKQQDVSSYFITQYVPEPARDAFAAIRAFSIEINKINDRGNSNGRMTKAHGQIKSTLGFSPADIKFQVWSDTLDKVFAYSSSSALGEPIAILLREAFKNELNLDVTFFQQYLQTRKHFLNLTTFDTINDIGSYGEGTYSQLNYLAQGLLLSPSISPSSISLMEYSSTLRELTSDVAAHIGQATAISSMILGFSYYATTRNQVTLPVDIMTKYNLSQENLLRLAQGHIDDDNEIQMIRQVLKNVLFDTATVANDHLITARYKLQQIREVIKEVVHGNQEDECVARHSKRWRKGIPDAIFVPLLLATPTSLYLKKLERSDFDIFSKKLSQKEWRLAWTSFRNYYSRTI